MATLLLAASLLSAPPWAADVRLDPAVDLPLTGTRAPAGVMHVPPRETVTFRVAGPDEVTIRLFGLLDGRGRKALGPGHAVVILDKGRPTKVALSRSRVKAWKVVQNRRWRPTAERRLTLEVPAGEHTIRVSVSRSAVIGAGLVVETAGAAADGVYEPPLPGGGDVVETPRPDIEEPPLPGEPVEPALPAIEKPSTSEPYEPALPGIEEPDLLDAPSSVSAREAGARMTVIGPPPATHVVTSRIGREGFLDVTIDNGLRLGVWGPGLLKLAIHAHRAEASPDSMRPVIVSLLVDEVLTQNVSIDQGVSPDYRIEDAAFLPSLRVNVRVPIAEGRHEVRVALSDSAVLGASILPAYESLTDVDEPGLLTSRAARGSALRATPAAPEVSGAVGLGICGAAWLPAGMRHVGILTQMEGTLGIPVAGPRLSIGLAGGYGRTEDPRRFADGRVPDGASRTNVVVSHVPLIADARWSAPIPRPVSVEAGVGGGVQLVWTEVRSRGVRSSADLEVAPVGYVHVTLLFDLGPGAAFVRGAYLAALPIDTNRLRSFDTGGGLAALGYRLALVSAD